MREPEMANQLYAALDLGTNTFHLLIAKIEDRKIIEGFHAEEAVKLGEGGIADGLIAEPAFNRGIEALKKFALKITEFKVEKLRAVGTAALRSAKNGNEFIQTVKALTGIEIELIEGEIEAELIYGGVKNALEIEDNSLIIDIGGGSVEFIFCNSNEVLWKKSYPIGAAKLLALFEYSDPISEDQIRQTEHYFDEQLRDLNEQIMQHKPKTLIGSAGAFETYAALCVKYDLLSTQLLEETSFVFNLNTFDKLAGNLLKTTLHEREETPEIIPVRVNMIIPATVLTRYILSRTSVTQMKLSTFALKEGLLYSLAGI